MKKATIAVVGCLVVVAVSLVIDLALAWALWLIYNVVAPNFHWPLVQYWTMFAIVVGISIIGNFFRSSSTSSK